MQNLLDELKETLAQDERLVIDHKLAKNKIVELGLKPDADLLSLLLGNDRLKEHFFRQVNSHFVFDKREFQRFISNKKFLPDSYTAFKNKIGLTDNGGKNYLADKNEISLIWPYKDCVLEGGQTKEDTKRNEIFWNETLAPGQIDRLLDPKALTGFKKFDKEGEHEIEEFSIDDNLIIKGNNLLALHSLKKVYAGKVKLIYIDPPYNTGFDFGYNDKFSHSTWLTFMRSRLEVAKELITKDGTLWVTIDDREGHYLKVLLDEVFGRENFISTCVWQKIHSTKNDAKYFSDNHDYIYVYALNKERIELNELDRTKAMNKRYKNIDNDSRGRWQSGDLVANEERKNGYYDVVSPSTDKIFNVPKGKHWVYEQKKMEKLIEKDRIWFGKDGNAFPRKKRFLSEVSGRTPNTWWKSSEVGHNQEAKREVIELFGKKNPFSTPKPENLMKRIIKVATDKGDIVLDFFAGSGTTGAVAHKMGRQYILCEQMDYVEDVTLKRLQKVIEGEQGGISKEVEWEGGGSFVYAELMEYNAKFINEIEAADSKEALQDIWQRMQENAFLSYKVSVKEINKEKEAFDELTLKEQKQFLAEVLDKNQLYVNYSEIEDEDYGISEEEREQNHQFYNRDF